MVWIVIVGLIFFFVLDKWEWKGLVAIIVILALIGFR